MDEHSSESKVFNLKMDEHSSESFTRIFISSWMSIRESNDFNLKILLSEYSHESLFNKIHLLLGEHSSESKVFNSKMDEHSSESFALGLRTFGQKVKVKVMI
jgi:hypothetical protein